MNPSSGDLARGRLRVWQGLICMLLAPGPVAAQGFMPLLQHFSFGMVALGPEQIARLSIVNIAQAGPTPACAVEGTFLDSQGKSLKSAKTPLEPQKSVALELDRSEVPGATGRVPIRAIFSYTVPATPGILMPGSVCTLVPTLEIFEKVSGKTVLVLSDAKAVPLAVYPPSGGVRP